MAQDLVEQIAPNPPGPREEWPLSALLNEATRLALLKIIAIVEQPLTLATEPGEELSDQALKLQRIVAAAAADMPRIMSRIQVAKMQAEQGDGDKVYRDMLAKVVEIQQKGKPKQ